MMSLFSNAGSEYFDLKTLKDYSGIAVPTLREHIKRGRLPAFKVKGKILIRRSEFDAWVDQFRLNEAGRINEIADAVLSRLKE